MLEFFVLAQTCAPVVHPQTLAALVRTESRFRPFAIGVNYGKAQLPKQPTTKQEAIEAARSLIGKGYNIDMGLGQINSANLGWLGLSVEDVFDPCVNLQAAARVLTSNFQRAAKGTHDPQQALRSALSAYNTGNFSRGFSNGYVGKVLASNSALAATSYSVPAIDTKGAGSAPAGVSSRNGPEPAARVEESAPAQSRSDTVRLKADRPRGKTDPTQVFANDAGFDVETQNALVY